VCGYAEPCLARPGANQQGTDKLYPFAIHNHPNFRNGLPQETFGNQERIRRMGMMKGYYWHFALRFLKVGAYLVMAFLIVLPMNAIPATRGHTRIRRPDLSACPWQYPGGPLKPGSAWLTSGVYMIDVINLEGNRTVKWIEQCGLP
jgi:hypothetical protein